MISKLFLFSLIPVLPAAADNLNGPSLPFAFVQNAGQVDSAVKFTGRGPAFQVRFESEAITVQRDQAQFRMTLEGGRKTPEIVGEDPMGAVANYFGGEDPDRWVRNLPMSATLRYRGEWKGIDLVFRSAGDKLSLDFELDPDASVGDIRLRFDETTRLAPDGSLLISGATGSYSWSIPRIAQEGMSGTQPLQFGYISYPDGSIGFQAASQRPHRRLVIASVAVFGGYFGGSSQSTITSIAVDSYYNVVAAGWTASVNLPASAGRQRNYGGGVDAFVAVFSPAGGSLLYCTYLGGSGDDRAFGVAVDASRNIYVTGWTSSSNFPVSAPLQKKLGGTRDAFVAKLNPALNSLIFSTFLGGAGVDAGYAIATDATGAPVIVGDSASTNLPVTGSAFQKALAGAQNVFVAKLTPTGNALTFLTYLGGNAIDHATTVKLDSSNNIYLGGSTDSITFPVVNACQPVLGGGQDGFLAKLTADGSALTFGTFLGGSGGSAGAPEQVNSIQIVSGGRNLLFGGVTSSVDFPMTSVSYPGVKSFQPNFGGGSTDGFIGIYSFSLKALIFSSYLGGTGDDSVQAITTDSFNLGYVTGFTTSSDFPTLNATQSVNAGGMDAFVLKTDFSRLFWSTYLGGAGNDSANAIAVDSLFNVVIGGSTGSSSLPVTGSLGSWSGSQLSSFLTKISPPVTFALTAPPVYIEDTWHNTGYNGPNITLQTSSFGQAGDLPIAGDWTGSGVKRLGAFRNGVWYLDINGNGIFDAGDKTVAFGQAGDLPVVGDWNGTGKIKLGLFRNGMFILDLSGHLSGVATGLSDAQFNFGQAGDIPVAADWNQSGTTKVGIFRSGLWLVDNSGSRIYSDATSYQYGQAGDLPVVGDWSGSGAVSLGVYRSGLWILDYNRTFTLRTPASTYNFVFAFGGSPYVPLIM